jgi:hypothetical protein
VLMRRVDGKWTVVGSALMGVSRRAGALLIKLPFWR